MMLLWCFERESLVFFFDEFCQVFHQNKSSRFHFYSFCTISSFSHYIFLFLFHNMTSFDRFAFALNEQSNCHVVNATNRARQQQFTIWVNFYEIIILSFLLSIANSTKSTFKRFVNDIIDTVNNDVASTKRRERSVKSKNDQRASSVNVAFAFYNFTFSVAITIFSRQKFRQEKRRFARFASHVSLFSQSFFQENDDDDEFDDFFFARSYVNLND